MTAELPGSLQQADGIRQCRASEEPDIDMSREGVDIPEARVFDTDSGAAIMDQLSNVVAAGSHTLEPQSRNPAKMLGLGVEPSLNGQIAPHGAGEAMNGAHGSR
jgi:hypothetical protein